MNTNEVTKILGIGIQATRTAAQASKFAPATAEVRDGSTTYRFQFLADSQWRLVGITTYGNHNFVNGPGCDASGFVVTGAAQIRKLNKVVGR